MSSNVQPVPPFDIPDFFYGLFGALFGGGIVWGRVVTRLENIEKRQADLEHAFTASEVASDVKRAEIAASIVEMRRELRDEITDTRKELRGDLAALQALILDRVTPR